MRCRSCDAELTAGARFCSACGAPAPAPGDPGDPLRTALESALGFQYRVERLLGRGGMGAVYLATELALDREVAIKVLPPDRGQDEEGHARFRREARTAARLSHPNIVPLLTFGEVSGLTYYVMAYVRGQSLGARMRRDAKLRIDEVVGILSDVADALDYAHRQGVVHRDIKPDNVLIDQESGRAMLTDFGLARARGGENLTNTGMIVGTPRYMSPEQAAGSGELDGRSDLYSLGLIAYEMIAGAGPFDGRTPAEQLLQRITRDPPPLSARAPETPAWLSAAVARCLARDPAARWPDARSLLDHLRSGDADGGRSAPLWYLGLVAQAALLAWVYGAGVMLWDLATGSLERWFFYHGHFDPEPQLFAIVLMTVLLGLVALDARRKGQPWQAIGAALVRQPRWWVGLYPRTARIAGDVWSRLPRQLRLVRTLLVLAPLLAWYVLLMASIDATGLEQYQLSGTRSRLPAFLYARHWDDGRLVRWPLLAYGVALAAAWGSSLLGLRRGPLAGLGGAEVWPVFVRSTANLRFWAKPVYARLLSPADGALRTGVGSRATGARPASSSEDVTATRTGPGFGGSSSRQKDA
jgi:predicted Ser/Thr protein kinase